MFDNPLGIVLSLLWFVALLEMQFLTSDFMAGLVGLFTKGKGSKATRLAGSIILAPVVMILSTLVHIPALFHKLFAKPGTPMNTPDQGIFVLVVAGGLLAFYLYFQTDTFMGRYLMGGPGEMVSVEVETPLPEDSDELTIVVKSAAWTFALTLLLNIGLYFLLY